jgi:tetratricopeptide (TPR) repeat protein
MVYGRPPRRPDVLSELPAALRSMPLAEPYVAATREGDHRRAAAAASSAAEQAADAWAHRALWHFERADMALAATRQARRIGDLRTGAGDPRSARRYYAEAISEARDLGAEREEGLAALGLGRAALDLGDVTVARRLAAIALDLLRRAGAPGSELDAAQELRGTEKRVGEEGA